MSGLSAVDFTINRSNCDYNVKRKNIVKENIVATQLEGTWTPNMELSNVLSPSWTERTENGNLTQIK